MHVTGWYLSVVPRIYERNSLNGQSDDSLPLVSLAQNIFSLVIETFPAQYTTYLWDGNQSEDGVFVVDECGMFELQEPSDLTRVLTLIVTLHLWLQGSGPS